jgi:hypothetical protein
MTSKERSFLVMLKVTYAEAGLHLECLTQPAEEWMALQTILAMRTGRRLQMEHCAASVLLRRKLARLEVLERLVRQDGLEWAVCDDEFVEVILPGVWVTFDQSIENTQPSQNEEGVFVAMLNAGSEEELWQLWLASQAKTAPIWR